MANIYLRVPQNVADFFRHKDEHHPLGNYEPLTFEDHEYEAILLRHGLCDDSSKKFLTVLCYSQQSWNNILKGKLPRGGKVIFNRDETVWPSAKEICALEGRSLKQHEELFDYLCIGMPKEVVVGGNTVRTDRKFSLDGQSAQKLANILRDHFYHYFKEWCVQEKELFAKRGLFISKEEMLQRFYAQYNIRISQSNREHNSLRQMAKRMFGRAEQAKNRKTKMSGEYFDYVADTNTPI